MSENRAPPTGPRSNRDYDSGRSTNPRYRQREHDGYKHDSYHKQDPRDYHDTYKPGRGGYSARNNYRPRGDTYKPRGGGTSRPPQNDSRGDRNGPSGDTPPTGPSGTKRSLPPSEPSSYRKRREYDTHPEYTSSFRGGRGGSSSRGGYSSEPRGLSRGRGSYPSRGSFSTRGGNASTRGGPATRGGSFSSRGSSYRGRANYKSSIRHEAPEDAMIRAAPAKLHRSQIYSVKIVKPSEVYRRVQQVGEGTYGKVYKAINIITEEHVALKKLRLETEKEGFPITAIREIKLLQSFDHQNIVGLLEMMVEHNQIYMIFDYMDHDLTGLLTHPELRLEESHRKFIFQQLMEGLNYLHKKRVIHRDIKGSNILLDSTGRLKIADFGLARTMKIVKDTESPDYTNRVITIWYRPPELLLGATDYGREVDVWGVGCLLIELYTKVAAFQGFDEVGQLSKILNIMGTPSYEEWPEIENLPWFEMLKPKINVASKFEEMFSPAMSPQSFDLAKKLLTLNPRHRLTADQALQHPYFTEEPRPAPLEFLKDIKGEWHEFETKKRRRKERKRLQDEAKASKIKELERREHDAGGASTHSTKDHDVSEPPTGREVTEPPEPVPEVATNGTVDSTGLDDLDDTKDV